MKTNPNLHLPSVQDLLKLHVNIGLELRKRGVTRSANTPTGDLAEFLFCKAFGWQQENNSKAGFDAVDENGIRYQIKGRRVHPLNKSRQVSAIRKIETGPFDFLAGVVFDQFYGVIQAAIIPISMVENQSTYVAHNNSRRFILHESVWNDEAVKDVTDEIEAALESI